VQRCGTRDHAGAARPGGIVAGHRHGPLGLDTGDLGRRRAACQQRILPEAATRLVPGDTDVERAERPGHRLLALCACVPAEHHAVGVSVRPAEGRGDAKRRGHGSLRLPRRSQRPFGEVQRGNAKAAQPGKGGGLRLPGSRGPFK
jgi:hypothetical protein